MAEQGRIVMPAAGVRASKRQVTSKAPVYSTSYRASFGDSLHDSLRVNFKSYHGHPIGTGFTSNQRPSIYYRPSLDHIDNPQLGLLLSDSFLSQTKRHFQPRIMSDFSLPNLNNKAPHSGFYQLRTHPTVATVEDKTEYQRYFVPHHLTPAVSKNHVVVGTKGKTGFTEGNELQFNTFLDKNRTNVELRQTSSSVMKNDFLPPPLLQGKEAIPALCSQSSRETGFTRGTKDPLACPSSLQPSTHTKSSAPTKKTLGKKEPTGSLLNTTYNQVLPHRPFDSSHFTTHYKSSFCNDVDKLRCGHAGAGILSTKMNTGYNRRDMDRFILSSRI